ncbi:cell adhesion molecule Dscam2-like [Bactrocera neohumeralis]|uniref:cell adhesion molecule Dscam2-like n=1 Tax=Bactrocera neohumeralis TaxID=98809 RepID=UPI0021663D6B|nr:cell adhesion molecule Dscam2-like [Bactrocera neohumeralis]
MSVICLPTVHSISLLSKRKSSVKMSTGPCVIVRLAMLWVQLFLVMFLIEAVVNQRYEPEVQNPGGFIGSNVLIKCNIPSFVKEYVTVTSWLQEPNFNIYPSLEGDGKNHMLPTGKLLVYNITRTDAHKVYCCRTYRTLTQNSVVSSNIGKIQLTGMPNVRMMPKLSAVAGKTFFLKCPVAGYPIDSIIVEKVME